MPSGSSLAAPLKRTRTPAGNPTGAAWACTAPAAAPGSMVRGPCSTQPAAATARSTPRQDRISRIKPSGRLGFRPMSGKSLRDSYHGRRLLPIASVALELRFLGAVSLRAGRTVPRDLGLQPKRLALLCYLALARPAGLVRRDALLAILWPELDEPRARNALSQALHRLRRELGPSVVLTRGHHEVGIALGRLWCDVTAFHDAVQRGDLQAAVALYRGELLPAFHVGGAPDFEYWLD